VKPSSSQFFKLSIGLTSAVDIMRKPLGVLTLLLAVETLLYFYRLGGLLAYLLPSVCWTFVALIVVWSCGLDRLFLKTNRTLVMIALFTSIFQITLLLDAGLLVGFGKSPYSFKPTGILLNLIYVSSTLLGMEFSRAYILSKTRKPNLMIILTTVLYTFIQTPLAKLTTLPQATPLKTLDFIGSQILTTIASNLLASTLALLGGPLASLAYRAPIEGFWWFSPVLPDLTWGWKTLIGVMPPIVGFITLIHQATPMELRKLGIKPERMGGLKAVKRERREALWTVAMCTAIILTVWFSTGLLGLFPTVAISGSMRPTIEVGDIAIIVKTPVERIRPGDIIQYATPEGMVLHRVIDIKDGYFITKGDACSTPDPEPVHPLNVRGKLIAIIPKLGWASIYVKEAIGTLWSLITTNNLTLYGTVSVATATAALAFYKTRRGRRWKRRRWVR